MRKLALLAAFLALPTLSHAAAVCVAFDPCINTFFTQGVTAPTLTANQNSDFFLVINNSSTGNAATKGITFYEGATQQGAIFQYSSGFGFGVANDIAIANFRNADINFIANNTTIANLSPVGHNGVGSALALGPATPDNAYTAYVWNTAQAVNSAALSLGTTSRALIVHEAGDGTFDFGHAQQTNPTIFMHSAAQSTTQWVSFAHDGTNGHVETGTGGVLGLMIPGESVTTTKTPTLGGGITDECGEAYISGDADGQTITMPNDPAAVGCRFIIAVDRDQSSNNTAVAPGAGETIIYAGNSYSTSCTAVNIGSSLTLVNVGTGAGAKWLVLSAVGTWTCS